MSACQRETSPLLRYRCAAFRRPIENVGWSTVTVRVPSDVVTFRRTPSLGSSICLVNVRRANLEQVRFPPTGQVRGRALLGSVYVRLENGRDEAVDRRVDADLVADPDDGAAQPRQ